MPPVPILKPQQVVKVFEQHGWEIVRQKGSHIIMVKKDNSMTLSIPKHKTVAKGTLRSLIQKSGLSVDQFTNSL